MKTNKRIILLSKDLAIYGQKSNGDTWALRKMNCFIYGMDAARREWSDT